MGSDSLSSVPRDSLSSSKKPLTLNSPHPKHTLDSFYFPNPIISPSRPTPNNSPSKRANPQSNTPSTTYHPNKYLTLNTSLNSDSELWILPDFEDWEYDDASPLPQPRNPAARLDIKVREDQNAVSKSSPSPSEWMPFVQRAASSNRERLRRRLEGDGWDFVGGKYGNGREVEEWRGWGAGEESVDEEFDVVVLIPGIMAG